MTPSGEGRQDRQHTAAHDTAAQRWSQPLLFRRMLEAQKRERELLLREFVQVKGLMPLLMRNRNGGRWSHEERRHLQQQLHALAHLSPYLVILVLPGSFMMLPVLAWWLDRRRLQRPAVRRGPGAGTGSTG